MVATDAGLVGAVDAIDSTMKLSALYTLLPLIAALPPLAAAHPTKHALDRSDVAGTTSYRKTLNFGASHPHASYRVPVTDGELEQEARAGLMTRDVKDAFDVARRVVEKRLAKVLGREVTEGEGYYIRDDVSCYRFLFESPLTSLSPIPTKGLKSPMSMSDNSSTVSKSVMETSTLVLTPMERSLRSVTV